MNDDSIATLQPEPQPQAVAIEPDSSREAATTANPSGQNGIAIQPIRQHAEEQTDTASGQGYAAAWSDGGSAEALADSAITADGGGEQADSAALGGFITLPRDFVADSAWLQRQWSLDAQGEGGDPTAYSSASDSVVGGVIIACFLVMVYALSNARGQIAKITRHIMDNRHRRSMTIASLPELRHLFLLVACTAAETGLVYYNYTVPGLPGGAMGALPMIGAYTAVALAYMMAKGLCYTFLNWVFFTREQRSAWTDVFVYFNAALGVALFPITVAQTYLGLAPATLIAVVALAVGAQKAMLAHKAYDIFFARSGAMPHTLLYFATLELLPVALLLTALGGCREALTAGL